MSDSDVIVWVLTSDAIGGDGQSLAIADALGWPYQRKRIRFSTRMRGLAQYHGRFFRPDLSGVDLSASDTLAEPWPHLVIAAGRRQVPVERWIKWRNGGRTRIVHIQRPLAPLGLFDLVICDGYAPGRRNVIDPAFPLMRKSATPEPTYLDRWRARFSELPRPWHMLFIGGPAAPFRLKAEDGSKMLAEVSARAAAAGGSVFISTSRRTPPDVIAAIRAGTPANVQLFEWSPGMADNPYQAMLALADTAIVTADSVSMMMEVARQGRPAWIYPLPEGKRRKGGLARSLYRARYQGREDWKTWVADKLRLAGFLDLPDNLKVFQRRFIAAGCGGVFGGAAFDFRPPPDELPRVVEHIRSWFA